ncbi:hypothetical protein [Streptomyces sp. NPDC059868]|uniref:hypothetical protein n=1 Tax=unclassified Streptomyces TaxID=2593676 RepID=UPI00093F0AD9|nr:hypothetical protein [Streptomyces sp. TSRI0107]OKJ87976.1 hypothetical protein AMK31_12670 [Streptomyces sp. TSRI0107]
MSDPVSRTILLLDIERFSDRDDVEQAYLRRMLYDITDRTLERAGIDETRRLRADRGDSVMELIDANAPVTALLRALLTEVPAQLRAVNRMASRSAQIRLRGVVASGWVAVDDRDGWVGSDLNHACRLLDADVLRAALRERADDFALCVSDGLYAGVVRHDHPGIPADGFHAVTVASKNGPLTAWLHGPLPAGGFGAAHTDHGERGKGDAPGGSGDRPAPPTPEGTRASAASAAGGELVRSGSAGDGGQAHGAAADEGEHAPAAVTGDGEHAPGAAGGDGRRAPAASAGDGRHAPGASAGDGEHAPAAPAANGNHTPAAPTAPAADGRHQSGPASDGSGAPAPGSGLHVSGGSVSFGGGYAAGDQHAVSGGQVTGDVVMGGKQVVMGDKAQRGERP